MTQPDRTIETLAADRALSVVRAERIPDAAALCQALVDGGIRTVELTFTTPDVLVHLARAAESAAQTGAVVGVGTVLTAEQAEQAVDAGARFLVTPGIRPAVAELAVSQGIPVFPGALTPTEVAVAVDLGATAVKVFPAEFFGANYIKAVKAPLPQIELVPTGGVNENNVGEFLKAGAFATAAGSSLVDGKALKEKNWAAITAKAKAFAAAVAAAK